MGLLTRARSVETGSGRPRGSEASPTSARGLLARSGRYRSAPGSATLFPPRIPQEELDGARSRRASAAAPPPLSQNDLQSALFRIPDGLAAPAQLFALLAQQLALARAALLLCDPVRGVFAPWASRGLDETTLHRLRIPTDAGGHLERLEMGEILLLDDPQERSELRRYFSTREHATMQALLLVPFVHEGRLVGVLLASQAARPFDGALLDVLRSLAPQMAALLYTSREQRMENLPPQAAERPEAMRERVIAAAQAAAARGHQLALIRISLESLARTLREHSPLADPFRLREDLHRIVLSLFRPLGSVLQVDAQRMLLVVSTVKDPDPALLSEHLRAALQSLLPQLGDGGPVDLQEAVRLCPPSAEEAGTCLAELV